MTHLPYHPCFESNLQDIDLMDYLLDPPCNDGSLERNTNSKFELTPNEYLSTPTSKNIPKNKKPMSVARKARKKQAGILARKQKQLYITALETSIEKLQRQIQYANREISTTKESVNKAILEYGQGQGDLSSTYAELRMMLSQSYLDLDRINLLLNVLKSRLSVNGFQQQVLVNYQLKQCVNTLFPPQNRYLMRTAFTSQDLFGTHIESCLSWTNKLYKALELTQQQRVSLAQKQEQFAKERKKVTSLVVKLEQMKVALKERAEIIGGKVEELSVVLTPIEEARLILNCEKWKFKTEIDVDFYFSKKSISKGDAQ